MATWEQQVIKILCTLSKSSYGYEGAIRNYFTVTYKILQVGKFTVTESPIQINCTTEQKQRP